jgi:hypothetical protein
MRCRTPLNFDAEVGDCGPELVFVSPIPGFAILLLFPGCEVCSVVDRSAAKKMSRNSIDTMPVHLVHGFISCTPNTKRASQHHSFDVR